MISVLIPYLAYPPYTEQIDITIEGLKKQTADLEIIVTEQPVVGKHDRIRKGKLHNEGFAKSKGDIIFHCDADIIFDDDTLLERMETALYERDLDVIYPMFWSNTADMYKLADGHPFMRRQVREEYGPLNEDDLGISLQEFRILDWLYFNKRFHCSREFVFKVNLLPFIKHINKADKATKEKCIPIAQRVVHELKKEGVWPTWAK
jgi:glycosyltransferase involved in cell wall biosynthesis